LQIITQRLFDLNALTLVAKNYIPPPNDQTWHAVLYLTNLILSLLTLSEKTPTMALIGCHFRALTHVG